MKCYREKELGLVTWKRMGNLGTHLPRTFPFGTSCENPSFHGEKSSYGHSLAVK